MPALLGTIRQRLRTDLKDDPATRWTDAVLDRHLARALTDYGQIRPLEQRSLIATTSGSRMLNIGTLNNLVAIEAIEYPVDLYPRAFLTFTHYAGTCELLIDELPTGANTRVYWVGLHTLTTTVSTVYPEDEEILPAGAAAYALFEYGQYHVERIGLGGDSADSEYHRQGREFMRRYEAMLDDLRRRNGLVSARLYAGVPAAGRHDPMSP